MKYKGLLYTVVFSMIFIVTGCSVVMQSGRRSDMERIAELENELAHLRNTKGVLEQHLAKEIQDKQVRLGMQDKGLVITFVAEVLFDSGKAVLRDESLPILDKVVAILNREVVGNNIGIEGHTDNEPIKYSKWESNWELSSHRALGVLHYLESQGVNSKRLSAIGYGEHRPIESNSTVDGRAMNRRVEIVILPKLGEKVEKNISYKDKEELK